MIISVSQFNTVVKRIFDNEEMLHNLSIKGEICNCRFADTNYFSIKDNDAQLDCYIPSGVSGFPLENGKVVIVHGTPSFYVNGGRLSFYVRKIEQTDNLGSALAKFLLLKEKLEKQGCFDESRKKTVSADNVKIGVVTSSTGAVVTDLDTVAHRRNPSVEMILYPCKVQGDGAELEIAKGIDYFSQSDVDVVIIGRGGGSSEDLSAFNTEEVVNAVCRCTKPTVSAVGHGIDFSLCDFACDKRVATPTEAAEITTTDVVSLLVYVNSLLARIANAVKHKVEDRHDSIDDAYSRMLLGANKSYQNAENRLAVLADKLDSLSALKRFSQGFAYVTKNGNKVSKSTELRVNDEIKLTFADGKVSAKVSEKE